MQASATLMVRWCAAMPGVADVCAGAPLYMILAAGEWRSPAFLSYIDLHKLETDLVVQAHLEEEDVEEPEEQ